jgi:hypothetical protein
MKRVTNATTGKFVRFEMAEAEYAELEDCYQGLCVSCGDTRDGCEPDAHKYPCESCRGMSVYGTQELLMMGRIKFIGEAD